MERPIGVIDSGVGGLTVVKEMLSSMPHESIVYIGDDKRCPYGSRTASEVQKFTIEMATALSEMNIKMLVIACNTATAVALDDVRKLFDFPVVGVIVPGARAAVNASNTNKIAVLATTGTIKSGAYTDEIKRQCPSALVLPLACPDFVPIVESGQYKSLQARVVINRTLRQFSELDFDAAILGCTHYPLLETHIKDSLRPHVKIISSAIETVTDVQRILHEQDIEAKVDSANPPIFFTTGSIENFRAVVLDWLSVENPTIKSIVL